MYLPGRSEFARFRAPAEAARALGPAPGFLKDGIQEAIELLVFKLVGSATTAAGISAEVQRIRQADAESSRTGQPSPGLDWAAITGRAADLRQAGQ